MKNSYQHDQKVAGEWAAAWRHAEVHFIPLADNQHIWGVTLCGFVMRPNVRFWTLEESQKHWGAPCQTCLQRLRLRAGES